MLTPKLYGLVLGKCAAVELTRERGDANSLGDADWLTLCGRMRAVTEAASAVGVIRVIATPNTWSAAMPKATNGCNIWMSRRDLT